jgi:lipopolysaccharide assembly protein B
MEIETWWLLALPLFFSLGWVAARIDIRQVIQASRTVPQSYLSGINFLIREQPDKALDALLEAARADPETVELHFALGRLFRRRGETERAIRLHQTLVERDDLSTEQRLEALRELGDDFLKIGMLDRAEGLFTRLLQTPFRDQAIQSLLEIAQQEKDWDKAILILDGLSSAEKPLWRKEKAHFHCERAEVSRSLGHDEAALADVNAALDERRQTVRASLLKGAIFLQQDRIEDAIRALLHIESQDPAYLALAAPSLMEAFRRQGRLQEGLAILDRWLMQHPGLGLLDVVFEYRQAREGPRAAYDCVREHLKHNPNLLGLSKLLEAARFVTPPEQHADIDLIKNLIDEHTRKVAGYRCAQCGFKARQFHWRCPACQAWESASPRRAEEYEWSP